MRADPDEKASFRRSLLLMPDSVFFELARNYLGELPSPFSKHAIIDRLEAFLSRPEILEAARALLSRTDAEALALLAAGGPMPARALASLLASSPEGLEAAEIAVLNLSERLLVYEDPSDGCLRISPPFAGLREELEARSDLAFPSAPLEAPCDEAPVVDGAGLAAAIAFIRHEGPRLSVKGKLERKPARELDTRLGAEGAGKLLVTALARLDVICADAGYTLRVVEKGVEALEALDQGLRSCLVAFAGSIPESDRGQLDRWADLAFRTLRFMDEGRAYSESAVQRLVSLSSMGTAGELGADMEKFLRALVFSGLLVRCSAGLVSRVSLAEANATARALPHGDLGLALSREASFDLHLRVGRIAEFESLGAMAMYRVTRGSVSTALGSGMDYSGIARELEVLLGRPPSQGALGQIASWADDARSLRLFEGLVLRAEGAKKDILEHSEDFMALVREELAPGLWLVDAADKDALFAAAKKAGIPWEPSLSPASALGRRAPTRETGGDSAILARLRAPVGEGPRHFAPFLERSLVTRGLPSGASSRARDFDGGAALKASLLKECESRGFEEAKAREIESRIRRGLILEAGQIDRAELRQSSRTEARGIDYLGKVRLIEEAARSRHALLEIVAREGPSEAKRFLARYLSLEKRSGELVLKARDQTGGDELEIPVSKISFMRLLRTSLFE